jgi:hypothetical protein
MGGKEREPFVAAAQAERAAVDGQYRAWKEANPDVPTGYSKVREKTERENTADAANDRRSGCERRFPRARPTRCSWTRCGSTRGPTCPKRPWCFAPPPSGSPSLPPSAFPFKTKVIVALCYYLFFSHVFAAKRERAEVKAQRPKSEKKKSKTAATAAPAIVAASLPEFPEMLLPEAPEVVKAPEALEVSLEFSFLDHSDEGMRNASFDAGDFAAVGSADFFLI